MSGDLVARLRDVLPHAWSIETSSRWSAGNPACGQCGVTALVVHDLLGGEILTTPIGTAPHFYNRIGGERLDLTAAQFRTPVRYEDRPSGRNEALADTFPEQYEALRRAVLARLALARPARARSA